MNVPPAREIPKLREQTRRYSAAQKEANDERRRKRLEAYLKAEEAARLRARIAEQTTTMTQDQWNRRPVTITTNQR